jgi:hypothetical protein
MNLYHLIKQLIKASRLNVGEGRRSDSRYRATSQMAAALFVTLPRVALADSLTLGYYRPPLRGFQFAAPVFANSYDPAGRR